MFTFLLGSSWMFVSYKLKGTQSEAASCPENEENVQILLEHHYFKTVQWRLQYLQRSLWKTECVTISMYIFYKACGWPSVSLSQCTFSTKPVAGLVCHYLKVLRCQGSESAIRATASDQVRSCLLFTVSWLCRLLSNWTTSGFLGLREVVTVVLFACREMWRTTSEHSMYMYASKQSSLLGSNQVIVSDLFFSSLLVPTFPDVILHISSWSKVMMPITSRLILKLKLPDMVMMIRHGRNQNINKANKTTWL